jgi:hypothetical protein
VEAVLIGINGFMGAGKDTVGDYLVRSHGFEKKSFAGLLKESVSRLFDIPLDLIEQWKNDPQVHVEISHDDVTVNGYAPMVSLDFRAFLQRYGTESHRDVFGYEFWVEQLFKTLDPDGDYVFCDARFQNELLAISHNDGRNIRVVRPGTGASNHASEVEPDPELIDAVIVNDGSIDQLHYNVDRALHTLSLNQVVTGTLGDPALLLESGSPTRSPLRLKLP